MKKLLLAIFILLFINLHGQEEIPTSLSRDLNRYSAAILSNDFQTAVDMTYDPFVTINGGDALYAEALKATNESNEKAGLIIQSIKPIGYSEIVTFQDEKQVLITIKSLYTLATKRFEGENQVLGISRGDMSLWQFVDLSNQDKESLQIFVPNMSPALELSEPKPILQID
ncbi:MAG TPA: hypothetical protein PK147_12360 [Saprospiraceae bacterium]|nr:hypothetical protein [Lewinellaceae bacterium]HPK09253.1 hypothetical protein [Saprospiraceae bacterium]HPQ22644.1 hypothetical protein [Saprospiraceae bacterium]HRX27984.1 hypothetical protein [Saprospiraceae bacterium]